MKRASRSSSELDRAEFNADIEIQHIKLELANQRAQHMRHFIDQYFCYRHGHINARGRANWESLLWVGHVSLEASLLRERNEVVKEHIVPLRVIVDKLRLLNVHDPRIDEAIRSVLDKYVHFATISKREDAELSRLKLGSKMPEGFTRHGHEHYEDLFARYKVAKIELRHHTVSCRPAGSS